MFFCLGLVCIAILVRRGLRFLSGLLLIFLFLVLFCRCILVCIYKDIVRMFAVLSVRILPFIDEGRFFFIGLVDFF